MLYSTRALADALGISITAVRNDVARGILSPVRKDRLGNRFTHDEALSYYRFRMTSSKVPGYLTYLRVCRRCTMWQLVNAYGLKKTAKHLGIPVGRLSKNVCNYRRWRKERAIHSKKVESKCSSQGSIG